MRQSRSWRIGIAGAGVLTVAAAIASAVGAARVAGVLAALLLGFGVVVAVDLRSRAADLAHMSRLAAKRQTQGGDAARERDADASLKQIEHLQQVERRLLVAVETERLRAADRHREALEELADHNRASLDALVSASEQLRADIGRRTKNLRADVRNDVTKMTRDEVRQIDALLQVLPRVAPRALMPPTGRWAIDARSLTHLLDIVAAEKPRNVVELGSGTSTVWLGYATEGFGTRITSFDHDEEFAALTRAEVARHGLADNIEVRTAPLQPCDQVDGAPWYDTSVMGDLNAIDLLLIDGPPGGEHHPFARLPAVPVLASKLSPNAIVLLDDSDRPAEADAVRQWCEEFGFERHDVGVSRLAVLRRPATAN